MTTQTKITANEVNEILSGESFSVWDGSHITEQNEQVEALANDYEEFTSDGVIAEKANSILHTFDLGSESENREGAIIESLEQLVYQQVDFHIPSGMHIEKT